jgi:hypothetical protein
MVSVNVILVGQEMIVLRPFALKIVSIMEDALKTSAFVTLVFQELLVKK